MATGIRGRRRFALHQYRSTPYQLPSCRRQGVEKEAHQQKKPSVALEKKDWEDATCSVCMDYPHNAVLLLCSSHDKGCRPYMCGTSYRYSNCLDQFKKAYTKVTSPPHGEPWEGSTDNATVGSLSEKCEVVMELACPLCRGQVKGMTVVEPAREYLNAKKRNCTQDNCTFVGTYKELRKHVRQEHPCARPREVDPILEQKWRRLERERERDDVLSTIRTSMPGAMVLGDYVIEGNHHGLDSEDEDGEADEDGVPEMSFDDRGIFNFLFLLQALTPAGNASLNTRLRRLERGYHRTLDGGGLAPVATGGSATDTVASEGDGDDDEFPVVHHRGRMVNRGRTVRRRRRRSQRRADVDMT